MSIIIRIKTLKTVAGFLCIFLVFLGGLQLRDYFNPQNAISSNVKEEAEATDGEEVIAVDTDLVEIAAADHTPGEKAYTYRLSRELARSQSRELLESIAADQSINEAQRQQARAELLAKARQAEAEAECEGALAAKGFKDVIVTINGKTVTVMMTVDVLEQEDLLQISDVVCRITNCSEEDIILIPH